MKRSTDLNEIIKLAKELLTKKSKEVELKTDNLIDLIVDEIYKTYKEFNK